MSHKLNDITLYYRVEDNENDRLFTGLNNQVSQLYVYFLKNYKPKKTTRISVQLNSGEHNSSFYSNSILIFNYSFDEQEFWQFDLENKRKSILNIIHEVALTCCQKYDWDKTVFENAYQKVLSINFENKISYNRKLSQNKKIYGETFVETNQENSILFIRFLDLFENTIMEIQLFTCPQHEMFYNFMTKKSKWLSKDEYGYSDPLFEWKVNINSNKPSLILKPKTIEEIPGWLVFNILKYLEFENKSSIIETLKAENKNWT